MDLFILRYSSRFNGGYTLLDETKKLQGAPRLLVDSEIRTY